MSVANLHTQECDHAGRSPLFEALKRFFLMPYALHLLAFAPATALLFIVAIQPFVPVDELMKDALTVAEFSDDCCHAYYGFVSNLGIVVWIAAAAICLFAGAVLFSDNGLNRPAVFCLSAGLVTGWLAIDDLFLVHEAVLQKLGVPQPVTYGAYAVMVLAYLWFNHREILAHRFSVLAVGAFFMGVSVLVDVLIHAEGPVMVMTEDGTKLLGMCGWAVFHAVAAFTLLSGVRRPLSA